jgi:ectoine hydroxylase-related dioxygenase (phytanoyl-CoA dioxygenase family)
MEKLNYKETLTELDGYTILEDVIPHGLLDSFHSKIDTLHPVRASSSLKDYAERSDIMKLHDIAVWWSQLVMSWEEVQQMNNIILPYVKECVDNAHWYTSDTVFIEPHSSWFNPHVDSPNRFEKWNDDKRPLGVQCIVPLYDLNQFNGATGLVPKSQLKNFPIDHCYRGYFNGYYTRNYIQPEVKKGSVLMYNTRLLHSSMPNPTDTKRPAILFNYLDNDIISEIRTTDNVWKSN